MNISSSPPSLSSTSVKSLSLLYGLPFITCQPIPILIPIPTIYVRFSPKSSIISLCTILFQTRREISRISYSFEICTYSFRLSKVIYKIVVLIRCFTRSKRGFFIICCCYCYCCCCCYCCCSTRRTSPSCTEVECNIIITIIFAFLHIIFVCIIVIIRLKIV